VIFGKPSGGPRIIPIMLCAIVVVVKGVAQTKMSTERSVWAAQASSVCTGATDAMELNAASLKSLVAMPLSPPGLSADELAIDLRSLVAESEKHFDDFRRARGISVSEDVLRGQRHHWCEAGLMQLVLGGLSASLDMLISLHGMSELLVVLVGLLVWCEDFPSGARFRHVLFPEEGLRSQRPAAKDEKAMS